MHWVTRKHKDVRQERQDVTKVGHQTADQRLIVQGLKALQQRQWWLHGRAHALN